VRNRLTARGRFVGCAALLLVGCAALLVAAVVAGSASVPETDVTHESRLPWAVQSSPFAIDLLKHGKSLVLDATGPAGPGSRLSYTLDNGSQHKFTSLLGSRKVAKGVRYRLATDERGRASTVTVTKAAHGIHVSWRLLPAQALRPSTRRCKARRRTNTLSASASTTRA
jgi:hypothetical protein